MASDLLLSDPALIMCDLHMPSGDAFELLEHIKGDSRLRDIPVFVMSSTVSLVDEVRDAIGQ